MELFTWLKGRQYGIDYKKWCFLFWRIGKWGFDGYFLKYKKGHLPVHTDPIDGGKHWRINIKLYGNCYFACNNQILHWGEFLHVFRPDINPHCLWISRDTLKISIGIVHFK